jgi:hypothetical protein
MRLNDSGSAFESLTGESAPTRTLEISSHQRPTLPHAGCPTVIDPSHLSRPPDSLTNRARAFRALNPAASDTCRADVSNSNSRPPSRIWSWTTERRLPAVPLSSVPSRRMRIGTRSTSIHISSATSRFHAASVSHDWAPSHHALARTTPSTTSTPLDCQEHWLVTPLHGAISRAPPIEPKVPLRHRVPSPVGLYRSANATVSRPITEKRLRTLVELRPIVNPGPMRNDAPTDNSCDT